MVKPETKFLVEVQSKLDGRWDGLCDEFGSDLLFDTYSEAFRAMKATCPVGGNCRVAEVELLPKRKNT